ncbi:MAG TPA: carbamoyl phosphate synthase small subunit [Bacillales bacterium]|nr:carbamoyl phosphate synthase small subunit [Bacillales bacterium]
MKGYLKLATGETFEGSWLGPQDDFCGEVVFFTGMTGYQEVISDPSFKGQIVVFTYPLIGNYGINEVDFESVQPQVSGVVLSETDRFGDHWQSRNSFVEELKNWNIPILADVDTRTVVQRIRTVGDIPGVLTTARDQAKPDFHSIYRKNWIKEVAGSQVQDIGSGNPHIGLIDFGYKKSIANVLFDLGCKVTIIPFDIAAETIESLQPDGLLLSNGPGNPKQLGSYLEDFKRLALTFPTLGICLGHQLLALAFGGDTEKLKFGHRGANQPVQDVQTGKVGMTAQNHSYVVTEESLRNTDFLMKFRNVNDGSVEGMVHKTRDIASVQFHPEGHPGPADFQSIFSDFVTTIKQRKGGMAYAEA